MEGLCTILYDTLRPFIIRIDHLETLAEICSILRVEMLDEHVNYNRKWYFGFNASQSLHESTFFLLF